MENATNNAKLFAKIAAVMAEIRTLEKTGENKFDRYHYVTADAIATKLGGLLAKHKIALLPSMVSVETSEYTTQKGGSNFRTVAHFQMTLACGETGATFTSMWSGEAIDRSDKSISKAAVSAVKYFLLKTFLLAGGDEEDADAESPTVTPRKHAPTPATEGGNPFEETSKPLATEMQLKRLHALGTQFYGEEWNTQRPKLVEAITTGATTSSKELSPQEADRLIKGIERRMAEVAQKQAQAA